MTDVATRLRIRAAKPADLPVLDAALGQRMFLADRLGRARHDGGELLIAWLDGVPVGDVYLWCEPAEEPELRERFPGVPILNHLEVVEEWRNQGIGTALVRAGEAAARRRGHDLVLIGVGQDNPDARRLYERLGYLDWGRGPITARWTEPDGRGGVRYASLTCDTLVGSLLAPGLDAWHSWQPAEVAARLASVTCDWYVVGGWAIDLWLGRQTREHSDLEIGIRRPDFPEIAGALRDFDLFAVDSGAIRPIPPGDQPAKVHQVWVCEPSVPAYRTDLFLEPGDATAWAYRRDRQITVPIERALRRTPEGIPFLCPEAVLLFKARDRRPQDEADFAAVCPDLDIAQRTWLAAAIGRIDPGHPWLPSLG